MDKGQLIDWIKNYKKLGKVIITHGEDVARDSLIKEIKTFHSQADIVKPKLMQTEGL